jgi:hypothetical protein
LIRKLKFDLTNSDEKFRQIEINFQRHLNHQIISSLTWEKDDIGGISYRWYLEVLHIMRLSILVSGGMQPNSKPGFHHKILKFTQIAHFQAHIQAHLKLNS